MSRGQLGGASVTIVAEDPRGAAIDISVILPVLDGEDTLAWQLEALANQTYPGPWELIVADNGSTDRTVAVAETWRDKIPDLIVVDASQRAGRAAACNAGARAARASTLAFCDADDVASPRWLEACVEASRGHDLVAGALDHYAFNPSAPRWKRGVLSRPPVMPGWKAFADGANLIVSRAAFEEVGGYCEELPRAADVDLSWRLEAAGYPLFFEPAAVMAKRGRSTYRGIWRQSVAWGAADVKLRQRHPRNRSRSADRSHRGFVRTLLRDARLRDRELLFDLVRPRHHRSWLAASARLWGRLTASRPRRT